MLEGEVPSFITKNNEKKMNPRSVQNRNREDHSSNSKLLCIEKENMENDVCSMMYYRLHFHVMFLIFIREGKLARSTLQSVVREKVHFCPGPSHFLQAYQ